jgi:hypothetical protein
MIYSNGAIAIIGWRIIAIDPTDGRRVGNTRSQRDDRRPGDEEKVKQELH